MNRYFIYTGNAYPHKNLSNLINAIVLLNKDREEKIFLKISSSRNIFTKRLEALIEKNKAQGYVQLLGYVPDEEIDNLYARSVAFVFPTLSEGFGLPPMEAINAGTLAVVSDIPVLKEVYSNSVTYFDPNDVGSIAQALERTLEFTLAQRSKMISKSQEFIKRYSWEKMARQTLDLYKSVV